MHFTLILIYSFLLSLSLSLSYFFFDPLKLSSLSTLYLLYACGFCVDFPLIFFFMGFYAYCVVMAVGCLLWWWGVAVVVRWRVWVCGSPWWRSEFMDWHGGA